jgi:hypothetical protein
LVSITGSPDSVAEYGSLNLFKISQERLTQHVNPCNLETDKFNILILQPLFSMSSAERLEVGDQHGQKANVK